VSDVIEKAAQHIAETMNGGEFSDGKWYSEGHRDAWVYAVGAAFADLAARYDDAMKRISDMQAELEYLRREVSRG